MDRKIKPIQGLECEVFGWVPEDCEVLLVGGRRNAKLTFPFSTAAEETLVGVLFHGDDV